MSALISGAVLLWTRLWSWLRYSWLGDRPFRAADVDEEPDRLDPRTVYVIKDAGESWAAVMSCPGGCGQVLHMNPLPDTKPVWKLTEHSDGSLPRCGAEKDAVVISGCGLGELTGVEQTHSAQCHAECKRRQNAG